MNKRRIFRIWPSMQLWVGVEPRLARRWAGTRGSSRLALAGLATALATLSVAVLPAPVASAAPITVTNCADSGAGSLRAAVAGASSGDTISFSVSCPPASPILLASPIDITINLTISGPGASQLAVSGNDAVQVFAVAPSVTATISGITVENGLSTGGCNAGCASSGGGIENAGTLTVINSTITGNQVVSGCNSNCGAFGGGIENDTTGVLTVTDSTLSDNSNSGTCGGLCSGNGGAIVNLGSLTVTDSTFSDNSSGSGCGSNCAASGAGIQNGSQVNTTATAMVTGSTFSGNAALFGCFAACGSAGGGIDNWATLTVTNSTLADNTAGVGCVFSCAAFGGGIDNESGATLTLTSSTLSANVAGVGCAFGCNPFGGDLYNDGAASVGATILANSGASGGDCFLDVPLTDLGYNLDDDGTCGFSSANHDFSDTPSGLDPAGLQDNGGPTQTIELQATSAAVDHVAAFLCPATDQRGSPRIAPCDIGAYDTDGPVADGSQVHAVIQVETSPSYADDPVHIDSSQLQSSCRGTITFETLQGGTTRNPRTSTNSITVNLDDDGNVTVVVDGSNCSSGTDVVEADLTVAPFLTALTTVVVEPPQVTPVGVSAAPANEVETGNSPSSGDSNVYTVFYVETSPVYAEQPVEISSPQLESRCLRGWRFEPGVGAPVNQASGTTKAVGILDDDGNAEFVFKGVSCAAGPSAVIADVLAGTHPTYVMTYTVAAPAVTLASSSIKAASGTTKKAKTPKHPKKHHGGGSGSGSGSSPAAMTVDASPNPLVETGVPVAGPAPTSTLNIVKSDGGGGTSGPPSAEGSASCDENLTYTITVTNSGTTTLNGVKVADSFSSNSNIFADNYTAAAGSGSPTGFTASATGSPTVNIHDTVNLPPGSSIIYTVPVSIVADGSPPLSNTATATPPAGTVLSPSSNTTATDGDLLFNCGT